MAWVFMILLVIAGNGMHAADLAQGMLVILHDGQCNAPMNLAHNRARALAEHDGLLHSWVWQ